MEIDIPDDNCEQIIIRLDVKDIIRCKSVCKSWRSRIFSPRFVKSHLDHSYKKDGETNGSGHRRIVMGRCSYVDLTTRRCVLYEVDDDTFDWHECHLAGSCNGLVCISPNTYCVSVVNPSTREVRRLTNSPPAVCLIRSVCWGFGYDPATDDYKVIRTFLPDYGELRCFQVLTLKSDSWKFVAHLRYTFISRVGTLCNGALHWLVKDCENDNRQLILSFCLSGEIFKEIPQPDHDASYVFTDDTKLGIFKGSLCIFSLRHDRGWVMRSYNVAQSWEKLPHTQNMQPDSAHYLKSFIWCLQPQKAICYNYRVLSITDWEYVNAPVFVQSLVSPHVRHASLKRKLLADIKKMYHKLLKEDVFVTRSLLLD